jgi:hypothetical protein
MRPRAPDLSQKDLIEFSGLDILPLRGGRCSPRRSGRRARRLQARCWWGTDLLSRLDLLCQGKVWYAYKAELKGNIPAPKQPS